MSLAMCILFLLLQNHVMKTNGMTLPLIHPESPESPVFESNLTYEQRVQRQICQTHARATSHFPATISLDANCKFSNYTYPNMVRPSVNVQRRFYIVQVGIGTFRVDPPNPPYMLYYLVMDTGSGLTWLQCEGCRGIDHKCFPQEEAVYSNSQSATFSPLPCNRHRLCFRDKCINNYCSYDAGYLDSRFSSSGILGIEDFIFNSHDGQMEVVPLLAFGCGFDNKAAFGDNNHIAGILGLGWSQHSIISQAMSLTEGQFSYCLPVVNKYNERAPTTYLRFGRDIIRKPNLSMSPLQHVEGEEGYYLDLQGISINQKRLEVTSEHFKLRDENSGNCMIDSGTPYSRMIKPAYIVLENALRKYFEGQGNLKSYKGLLNLDLCYEGEKLDGFKNLPSLTFHFQNADLVLQPEAVFLVMDKVSLDGGEYFCLAIVPSDFITILGSYQQTNHHFIYNILRQELLFNPDDCSNFA